MKKTMILLTAVCCSLLLSCHEDPPLIAKESGGFTIRLGLSLTIRDQGSALKATAATDDFSVSVYSADSTELLYFERASEMPDTILLEPGYYFVQAAFGENPPAAFDSPWYFGSSELFSISSGTHQEIEITCSLSNSVVSVYYSDRVKTGFETYSTLVSTDRGSLLFEGDEYRQGYFIPSPMDILVRLNFSNPDGSTGEYTLSGNIPDPLPGHRYEIRVDAGLGDGSGSFTIMMDTAEAVTEVIYLNDIDTTATPSNPENIQYGDLLITEIMPDPSALADTEGEWFEIYNASTRTIDLQGLVILRDGLYGHVIADALELTPGSFAVLARTSSATTAPLQYVYGAAITLSNTGAILSIHNKGTVSSPGDLIFSVDYGSEGFPAAAGYSLSLSPENMEADAAVTGSSWCLSSSVYSTGDHGTPGILNDVCP